MKGKWFVAIVAILITVLGLYQLSYTFVANKYEKEASLEAEIAAEDFADANDNSSEKEIDAFRKDFRKEYIDSLWETEVYAGKKFKKVKQYALNLGLDLQGGTHATVIVSPDNVLKSLSNNNEDPAFNTAVENAKKSMKTTQGKFTDLFYDEWEKVANDRPLSSIFLSPSNPDITLETSDSEILELIDGELAGALTRSVIILRSRIDKFGASNPVIQPVASTGRIEIEIPGLDSEERIRKQIEKVAHLEFVKPYDAAKVNPAFQAISIAAREKEKAEQKARGVADSLLVDSVFVADFQKALRPFSKNQEGTAFGFFVSKGDLDLFNETMASKEIQAALPGDLTLMLGKDIFQLGDISGKEVFFMTKGPDTRVLLDGERVSNSYPTLDPNTGGLAIAINFDAEGAAQWARITEENLGKQVAIVLDNEVYSDPVIQGVMKTGSCTITNGGNKGFEVTEANELAGILKVGKLPAKLEIEELSIVGPSIGDQAVSQGLISLLVGLGLVIIFMFLYYGKGGLVANVALLFNIFFIIGILATPSFAVTLTLPGIAGIVLTIGMSIDANVLIFERIREELALGASKASAVTTGYAKAFWTIFDANITTFLTALVLYIFGTGLVKGFAVTLMVGVVASFFAAVFVTRLIIEFIGAKNNFEKLSFTTSLGSTVTKKRNIDFIGKRKLGYIFSGIVLLIGVAIMATKGLNLGVEFKGGYSYVYSFANDVNTAEVRTAIKAEVGNADVQVKTYDKANQVNIVTSYLMGSDKEDADALVKQAVEKGVSSFEGANFEKSTQVGASFADDIKTTSRNAVIIALIVIFFYIIIRFRKWQFGLGSLLALFHDVLFVLSIFAICSVIGLSFEIGEVFIAAVLTLVGYSINDTVVVFDRVREYLGLDTSNGLKDTLNQSLNSTLSRTLITSFTTLLVVAVLLIFGGEALRGFSFALFVGILVGTYSSIFIATPVVYDFSDKGEEKK